MKLRAICGRCNVKMHLAKFPGLVVHTCLKCDRVAVVGHGVMVGDMFEARMKARGYHRL